MAFTISTLAVTNVLTILMSLALIIISIFTFHLTNKATDHDFSTALYKYYMASNEPPFTHLLEYDFVNENLVLASAGMALAAGVAGITAYLFTRNAKPTLLKNALINIFPALAFILSLLSIIVTSTRHTRIKNATCHWGPGMEIGAEFHCTRELGVCLIVNSLKGESGLFEPIVSCDQLHLVRTMLIPLTVVSAAVLGLGVARMVVGGKGEVGRRRRRLGC